MVQVTFPIQNIPLTPLKGRLVRDYLSPKSPFEEG
jgi:hypothetical protein